MSKTKTFTLSIKASGCHVSFTDLAPVTKGDKVVLKPDTPCLIKINNPGVFAEASPDNNLYDLTQEGAKLERTFNQNPPSADIKVYVETKVQVQPNGDPKPFP
jgi:hypothetical protein